MINTAEERKIQIPTHLSFQGEPDKELIDNYLTKIEEKIKGHISPTQETLLQMSTNSILAVAQEPNGPLKNVFVLIANMIHTSVRTIELNNGIKIETGSISTELTSIGANSQDTYILPSIVE